jgi:sulfate transporter 4
MTSMPSKDSHDAADDSDEEFAGRDPSLGDPLLRRRSRIPFISEPRQVLERIQEDSLQSRRHAVPHEGLTNGKDIDSINGDTKMNRIVNTVWAKLDETQCSIATVIPAWAWIRTYPWKTTFHHDLVAGLTVGFMVIPQSISYAKLAGLPVEYGLYSALMPVYAYALFGTSRQLAVGPVALISLLLNTGLSNLLDKQGADSSDEDYQDRYNRLAVQVSFLVGVAYIVMGLLRMGFVTIFLSHAVVSGFTTGAAVIIAVSQVKYLLGYSIPRSDRLQEILHFLIDGLDKFNWKSFVLGSLSIAFLVGCKNIASTFPRLKFVRALGPLTITVVTIVLSVLFDFKTKGIPVVGNIPQGLPAFTASKWFPLSDFSDLVKVVVTIAIVGFMESVAIAKKLASIHKYEIDSSQELLGLGVSVSDNKVPSLCVNINF